MKTTRLLLGTSLCLLLAAGASADGVDVKYLGFDHQNSYHRSDSCGVKIMRNGVNPLKPERMGRMEFRDGSRTEPVEVEVKDERPWWIQAINAANETPIVVQAPPPSPSKYCDELDVVEAARRQACMVGARLVNFHSVEYPSDLHNACFWATADFYADTAGFVPAAKPFSEYNSGLGSRKMDAVLSFEIAGITGGELSHKHLNTSINSTRLSLNLSMRKNFGRFGVLADINAGWVSESYLDTLPNTADTQSVHVSNELKLRLGPSLNLLHRETLQGLLEVNLAGGANYTLAGYSKDFTGSSNLKGSDGYASGFGWFAKADLLWVFQKHWSFSMYLLEEYEGPSFSDGTSLDGYSTGGGIGVGYHFRL